MSGWNPFVDGSASEITVSDGRKGMSSQESKTAETQQSRISANRDILHLLTQSQMFNSRMPTGRLNAEVNSFFQNTPKAWQPSSIADYQSFNSIVPLMIRPAVEMSGVNSNLSATQMDSGKELDFYRGIAPSPKNEREANEFIVNSLGSRTLTRLARDTFLDKWRQIRGSTHAMNKAGIGVEEAWSNFLSSPRSAPLKKPLTQYYDERLAKMSKGRAGGATPSITIDANGRIVE